MGLCFESLSGGRGSCRAKRWAWFRLSRSFALPIAGHPHIVVNSRTERYVPAMSITIRWERLPFDDADGLAFKHIFNSLTAGAKQPHILSQKLLFRLHDRTGKFFAIAYENIALDRVTDFKRGAFYADPTLDGLLGMCPYPPYTISHPLDGLADFIAEFLAKSDNNIAVLENSLQKPSFNWTIDAKRCVQIVGEGMYHVLTRQNDLRTIKTAIVDADTGNWLVGVLARDTEFFDGSSLTAEILGEIAMKAQHLFVSAFDGQGFLVWTPDCSTDNK